MFEEFKEDAVRRELLILQHDTAMSNPPKYRHPVVGESLPHGSLVMYMGEWRHAVTGTVVKTPHDSRRFIVPSEVSPTVEIVPEATAEPSEAYRAKKVYGSQATIGEFIDVVEPVMKLLSEHFNPHTQIIIDTTTAEVLSGLASHNTMKYVKD